MEKNKKDKIVVLIVIIGLCIVGALVYFMFFFDDIAKDFDTWNEIEERKYSINIVELNDMLYFDSVLTDTEKSTAFIKSTYYCKKKNCTGYLIIDDAPYAIIKDGKNSLIFNYDNNTYRYLNIFEKINKIDILYKNSNLYGLVVGNDDNEYKVYSFNSNSFITDNKYVDYENNSAAFLDNKFIGMFNINNESAYYEIIDLNNGNSIFSTEGAYTSGIKLISKGVDGNIYYLLPSIDEDGLIYDFYDSKFNVISTNSYGFLEVLNNGNAVIKTSKNEYGIFDSSGKLIKKSKYYNDVIMLCKDYLFVVDNDNLIKIVDYSDNNVATVSQYFDSYYFHTELSGWYNYENNNVLYLVIEDMNDIDGVGGRSYEYYYNPKTKVVNKKVLDGINNDEKPILYIYPEEDNTNVTVKFEKPNLITTSYPKYINEWNVIANKNGDLFDSNNNYYYGLYFEEENVSNIDFEEGFYVTKENAIEFLEDKLSIIGLNDREKNEFIMYWLPVLEKNEKSIVYFELTSSRQKYNKLIVYPKPDSMLRFAIHIKKVNSKVNIKNQILPTFNRKGFTVVEWGGVNHK